jgi:hypothetical protein
MKRKLLIDKQDPEKRVKSKQTVAVFVLGYRALRKPIYLPCIGSAGSKDLAPTIGQYTKTTSTNNIEKNIICNKNGPLTNN